MEKKTLIKVWDYLREYEVEKKEILSAIEQVLDSGWLILGNQVKTFENEFSEYCDTKFGVGVNSATDALFLSLKALNIGKGDEVITVSNTAVPTVSAIVSTGATPVFVDVEMESHLMNVDAIEEKITQNTKCIIPVHLFGQCVDMRKVNIIAKKHGLYVIEDCAQCHGATFEGKKAGSMSDLAAFSFYPTKVLGGFGDGGMVVTKDELLYNRLMKLRMYGMKKTYYATESGFNSRLDELHAAILIKKLSHLDSYIKSRRKLASLYNSKLKTSSLILPKELKERRHVYYIYVVRHPDRDQIIEKLKENNILVNISYPWPIHTMVGYNYLGYKLGDLPNTEKLANEIFSLPMYPSLSSNEVDIVCKTLNNIIIKL